VKHLARSLRDNLRRPSQAEYVALAYGASGFAWVAAVSLCMPGKLDESALITGALVGLIALLIGGVMWGLTRNGDWRNRRLATLKAAGIGALVPLLTASILVLCFFPSVVVSGAFIGWPTTIPGLLLESSALGTGALVGAAAHLATRPKSVPHSSGMLSD
jgi:hypothetical protein